ncbi:MAG: PEP-CTERM sorting domain-containing protein [Acidobacteriia bacterium]|nr:PEP-CTERM sorting domain-containing protein [Terriglobia bacterium]
MATYDFQNTLSAEQGGGVPALIPTDPLGENGFVTDTVDGQTRKVYAFNGSGNPPSQQAGLSFDNSGGLLPSNSYSIQMVFEFLDGNLNGWRRLVDVQNRQSDDGFYVDPSNNLDVYPVGAGSAAFANNAYEDVVLTDSSSGVVTGYLNGAKQFTLNTTVMDINNPQNLINLFLDNDVGGGIGEFASGRIAEARFYSGVLSDAEVAALDANPLSSPSPVPEPSFTILMGAAMAGLVLARRLRQLRLE